MNERVVVKRRRTDRGRHFGGSWKVAYADFVTALMAFFMVMWILGMSEKDRSVIAAYFSYPVAFAREESSQKFAITPFDGSAMLQGQENHGKGASSVRIAAESMNKLKGGVQRALGADPELAKIAEQVEVKMTTDGLRIEMMEKERSTFFASGSAELLPAGRALLARIGPFIARAGHKIILEGHTDAVPYPGTGYTNWDLSADRASSVRRALFAAGVKESQLVAVNGFAAKRLKDPAKPTSPENRRVTILMPLDAETAVPSPGETARAKVLEPLWPGQLRF